MSTATLLMQVIEALDPQSDVPLKDKVSILQTFSSTLKEPVTMEQSREILSTAPLGLFYHGLSLEEENLTNVLCEVINKLLGPFSYTDIVSPENKPLLTEGLAHYNTQIRLLSVQQVFKCLVSNDLIQSMLNSDIYMHILTTLAFQDTKTAQKASELLYKAAFTEPGQEVIFNSTTCAIFKQLLKVNETVKFRIYDLLIRISSISDHAFELCEATGLLHEFMSELTSDDLLVKINAIELLNEVAVTPAGLAFLEKANLVDGIAAILDNEDEADVAVVLVKCSIIKFIGNLGENTQVSFKQLSEQYGILDKMERIMDTDNDEILIVTISSIGLIGSHLAGLDLLLSNNPTIISKLFNHYHSSIGPVKAVILQTLSKLIGVRDEPMNESDKLTLMVFKQYHGFPTRLIAEAKQPDDDIRTACFALMQSIAFHQWGLEYMSQSNEFMQYILDRTTERMQQGQLWKFTVIQTLTNHSTAKELLGNEYYPQCIVYIRQGPYYKPLEATVAFESS
ncbi:hypothetical protein RMATCC62417_06760 [Rhizopus microsporus]|nr:hypothetical protein RMATCC62417_06760 [Rhizopus microsporus]